MVRFLSAGTVHDGAPPKLATTTALPSGQGTLPLCPTSPTSRSAPHRSAQFPQPLTASAPRQRSPPVAATRLHTKSLLPPRRPHRCSRGDSATKPIKEPTLSCGLAHCTVSSLSRRSPQPPFSALARRETNETFFSHNGVKDSITCVVSFVCSFICQFGKMTFATYNRAASGNEPIPPAARIEQPVTCRTRQRYPLKERGRSYGPFCIRAYAAL